MLCPNDFLEIHQVKIASHYGQLIIIDQCQICGGIWFDAFELYQVKHGEAERIESLDSNVLFMPSAIANLKLLCPKDRAELVQFSDPYFPKGIVVARCPKCSGFWLNRGEFTKYQKARLALGWPKEVTPEDIKLENEIKQLLAAHHAGSSKDGLKNLGTFLSKSIREEPDQELSSATNTISSILNILVTILKLFVFRV